MKSLSYEERKQRFGNINAGLLPGDSLIIPENDGILQEHSENLVLLPEQTAKCPVWQWEAEVLEPSKPENRAFNSPRAGGEYEIEARAEQILLNSIIKDFNVELHDFANRHDVNYTYSGIGDIIDGITFHSNLTEEQEQEFLEDIYNKHLLKVNLSAWIAKQNLLEKKKAIITTDVLEKIKRNPYLSENAVREDLLLVLLSKCSYVGGRCTHTINGKIVSSIDGPGQNETHIQGIDDSITEAWVTEADFSRLEISTLIYCTRRYSGLDNGISTGVLHILSRLREDGFITFPPKFCIDQRTKRLIKVHDPLNVNEVREARQNGATDTQVLKIKLTIKGRQRADAIIANRKVFVAMSFAPSMTSIYEKGIKKAIQDTGYEPRRVDEVPHINLIPDEILKEIKDARFVVADFSIPHSANHNDSPQYPPGGVYYEVGYAQALKKQVLWTCRHEDVSKLHFDISQYNFLLWEDKDDLYNKLRKRIPRVIADI